MYNYEIEICYENSEGLDDAKFLTLTHELKYSSYELETIIEVAIAEFDCITDFEFELYSWLKTNYEFGTPKIHTGTSIDFDRIMEEKYE